jgi:hypothetical protein
MVGHLMVLNPRGRKSAGRKKRHRKMTAKQLRYFGPKKSRKAKKAKAKVVIIESNPKRKRRNAVAKKRHRTRATAKTRRRFRSNPRAARRRFRRNPIGSGAAGFLGGTLMPAAIGAGGALAVDLAIGNLPLPASMKTGAMLPMVRIAAALGVGMLVGMAGGEEAGSEAAAGGIIVTVYSLMKNYMATSMPSVRMARYVSMGAIVRRRRRMARMARYVKMNGLGALRPRARKRFASFESIRNEGNARP